MVAHTSKMFLDTFDTIVVSYRTKKYVRTPGTQLKPFLSEIFAFFFCVKFLLLFFQPNFFKKISDRNGFNCVPGVRTYFLVLYETTMVSKVSQKSFEVCATKRHKPRNFDLQKFRCAFGCRYFLLFQQTRLTPDALSKQYWLPA